MLRALWFIHYYLHAEDFHRWLLWRLCCVNNSPRCGMFVLLELLGLFITVSAQRLVVNLQTYNRCKDGRAENYCSCCWSAACWPAPAAEPRKCWPWAFWLRQWIVGTMAVGAKPVLVCLGASGPTREGGRQLCNRGVRGMQRVLTSCLRASMCGMLMPLFAYEKARNQQFTTCWAQSSWQTQRAASRWSSSGI